jgi:Cu2+-exporting ATPase
MTCCSVDSRGILAFSVPSTDELKFASRDLGDGRHQLDLSAPDIHCGACITTIEGALAKHPFVERARVNLSAKRIAVIWRDSFNGRATDPVDLVMAVNETGYEVHLSQDAGELNDELRNQLLRAVAVAGFAATNIMLLSVSIWSGADATTRDLFHWISALIAAPALIYSGRFFFASAWKALKHGHTNMDVPISLAVLLSYGVSLWETMHHGEHAWFDATASLLFFLLIGRTLDHFMRDKARSAISGLARLSPRGAMIELEIGGREYRPIEDIRPGNRLLVAAGERIPVDAVVRVGESDIDWSIVNGESAPATARSGTRLLAGTLNLTGSLVVEAVAEARNSFLAEIMSLMEAAEGGKARYRRIADRAAQLYSPAVHLLALLSFLGWGFYDGDWKHAMLVAVAVLIITCPCALGLAVPVVQVVAAGRLFRNGIMVKDGSAMERLAEIDTAYFDKTGTLTLGKPILRNSREVHADAFAVAAGLAGHSRHPIAGAISLACPVVPQRFGSVSEIAGAGLEARDEKGTWRLGQRAFALQNPAEGDASNDFSEAILSFDGSEVATFRFEDLVRPDAAVTIRSLHRQGIKTSVWSGDRPPIVAGVARKLGIEQWAGGLAPQGKVDAIIAAQTAGAKVLMVGDGINDAPALRIAYVSMAPSTAADIGRQAADFVFLRTELAAVTHAIDVARRAGRLIRENFALAIGYNVIAVPIAILGQASPLVAAIAMSTSSIIVVANSLRLNELGGMSMPTEREHEPRTTNEVPA